MTAPIRLSFSWSTRREGNDGYVLEQCPTDGYRKEFGPIPAHTVPAFVIGRRRIIAMLMKRRGASYVLEN
jgi:hypothetical protein